MRLLKTQNMGNFITICLKKLWEKVRLHFTSLPTHTQLVDSIGFEIQIDYPLNTWSGLLAYYYQNGSPVIIRARSHISRTCYQRSSDGKSEMTCLKQVMQTEIEVNDENLKLSIILVHQLDNYTEQEKKESHSAANSPMNTTISCQWWCCLTENCWRELSV